MRKHDHEGGFTLVEIMTVVLILGILAAIAVPFYRNHVKNSQIAAMKTELAASALLVYQEARDNDGAYLTIPATVNLSEHTVLALYTKSDPREACLEGYADTAPDNVWRYSFEGRVLLEGSCSDLAGYTYVMSYPEVVEE